MNLGIFGDKFTTLNFSTILPSARYRPDLLGQGSIARKAKESRSSVWLEHYTDNVGVSSSTLLGTTK